MHVVMAIVGGRTEPWVDLIATLVTRPDIELTVFASRSSPRARRDLNLLARKHPHLAFHHAPTLLGGAAGDQPGAVVLRPGAGRVLRTLRPDVLHIIGEAGYPATFQILRMRRRYWPHVPATLYATQNVPHTLPFPFAQIERRTYASVHCAFPITPAAEKVLRTRGYRGESQVVPQGVDTELFRPYPQARAARASGHPFTVGYVGWLERHKGIPALIEAAEKLDCDLVVVGRGSLTPAVEAAAARRPGRVTFRPRMNRFELPRLMADMDVLAMPSTETVRRTLVPWTEVPVREPFGRVLVEAMSCGVPVVGSNLGEIPHVIGPAGLTFRAGDTDALIARLAEIRDDDALARRLGAAGQTRSQLFSWSTVSDSMCRTWQALVDTHVVPARTYGVHRSSAATAQSPTAQSPTAQAPAARRTREKEGQR
ncbi:glycosyltransferase [Actinopolymorpha sp. B9G3]|uniref:glycosyltransferase family 4 protein n=1 Tax=Actinopolymorpha sp. B9G3 TaxID=3158970 RepID=UPI0032D8C69F